MTVQVALSELENIAVLVRPEQLARIEAHPAWQRQPIHLRTGGDGRLWLNDGAHRLTLARRREAQTIEALVDPFIERHGAEAATEI